VYEAVLGWGRRRIHWCGAGGLSSSEGGRLGPTDHAVTLSVVTDGLKSTARASPVAMCLSWGDGGTNPAWPGDTWGLA